MQSSTSVSYDSAPCDFFNMNWLSHDTLYGNFCEGCPASTEHGFIWWDDSHDLGVNLNIESSASGTGKRMVSSQWDMEAFQSLNIIESSGFQSPNPLADGFQSDNNPRKRPRLSYTQDREDNDDDYRSPTPIDQGTSTSESLPSESTSMLGSSTSFLSSTCQRTQTDRHAGSVTSRNTQATGDEAEDIRVKLSHRLRRTRPATLVCPVKGCGYQQLNGRRPDFRRHLRTHIRKDTEIQCICKGVALEDFIRHRHLFPHVSEYQKPYTVPGRGGLWIGGCKKTFSRADALKRHLKNTCCAELPSD